MKEDIKNFFYINNNNIDKDIDSNNNDDNRISKLNPEIKYIIENTTKYKYYKIKTNKYNNYSQPYFPYGAIYPIAPLNSNIISKGKEEQNKKNFYEIFKKENSVDLYQESNSMSHLSTTSEGEQGISTNFNNYFFYQSFPENKKKFKKDNNKNEKFYESIKKGINDISDYLNYNKNNNISLACYYYCRININEEDEYCLRVKIQQIIDNKEVIKK